MRRAGTIPGAMRAAAFGAATALVAACTSNSADQVVGPIALGMTDTTAPFYDDGTLTLYEVMMPVPLPVRQPTDAEASALGDAPPGTPYPHAPFLRAEDETIEVRFTISNIDDQQHDVWLLVDPWNEFVRWRPGVTIVAGENARPNFGYDLAFPIAGKSRVQGTITTDDMREIAIKIASVEKLLAANLPPPSNGSGFDATQIANNIFNPQNRSNSGDTIYASWIPPVIAGVTGFDLGLRTLQRANVAVEVTIDVRDTRGDRFVPNDSTAPELGEPPQILSPPSARL